jgi:transposase
MEYGAIDLHKKESQVRIVTETGEVLDRRIPTTRDRFTALFWGRPRLRILLEASTESEWVAQHLESLGHEVVVADPNYTPMYGQRSRRIKTDQRDVAALTDACERGIYRVVHRRSAPQRTVQSQLNVRRELTDSRTRAISLARAIIRGAGFRIRSGSKASFLDRVTALLRLRRTPYLSLSYSPTVAAIDDFCSASVMNVSQPRPFGAAVRQLREQAHITKAELQRRAGISNDTMHRLEAGDNVRIDSLERVATALNVSLARLFVSMDEPPPWWQSPEMGHLLTLWAMMQCGKGS